MIYPFCERVLVKGSRGIRRRVEVLTRCRINVTFSTTSIYFVYGTTGYICIEKVYFLIHYFHSEIAFGPVLRGRMWVL